MYWRRLARKPANVLLWVALPFAFMAMYMMVFSSPGGSSGGGVVKVGLAVIDEDAGFAGDIIKRSLAEGQAGEMLTLHDVANLDTAENLFNDDRASGALLIPAGFSQSLIDSNRAALRFYRNTRHFIGPQITGGVIETMVSLGNGLLYAMEDPFAELRNQGRAPTPMQIGQWSQRFFPAAQITPELKRLGLVDVATVDLEAEESEPAADFNFGAMFFPGLVLFGLMSVSLAVEHRFLIDRNEHVNDRLRMTPQPAWRLLLEQRLFAITFMLVVGTVTAIIGGIVWSIPPVGLLNVAMILLAVVTFVVGINASIFSLSNSQKAVGSISTVVMMVLMLFGGGFFPVTLFPDIIVAIARWIPTGIANIGLIESVTGAPLTVSIPLLAAISLVFFALSIVLGIRKVTP